MAAEFLKSITRASVRCFPSPSRGREAAPVLKTIKINQIGRGYGTVPWSATRMDVPRA